jgi:serine/threonine-protein kinase
MAGSGDWQSPKANSVALGAIDVAGLPEGTVIAGKYQVERTLGVGGMGVVIAALHMHLGQRVAIKFMRAEAARDANAVGRFVREARAAAALANEHVTRVLDVGTLENGAPYMVMEYLAGVDLGEVVAREGPLSVPLAVDTVLQACEALAEAHARGIVHRDLKPANLFATSRPDGSRLVKVLDFGISKAIDFARPDSGNSLTASGLVMGSPGYMSPEQIRSSKEVDARTDVWSLGVILYELLAGVSPFAGESMGETLAKIVADDPPSLAQIRHDVPPGLTETIARCLARTVEERIQSVAELAPRLLPFADAEATLSVKRILRLAGVSDSGPIAPTQYATAQHISERASSPTERAWLRSGAVPGAPSRGRLWLVLGAAAAVLGTAAFAGVYATRAPSPSPAQAAAASVSASVAPSALAAPVREPSPEPAAAGQTAIGVSPPARKATRDDETSNHDAPRAAAPAAPAAVSPTHHAPAASPAASQAPPARNRAHANASAVNCDPPFTLDSAGFRIPKPECL